MPINGRALAVAGLGVTFVWSGIRGWSVLGTIGDAISGKKASGQVVNPLTPASSSNASAPSAAATPIAGIGSGIGIAAIAAQYVGHAYVFGSAPGTDGSKPWDCSSFVNWIVGVKAGHAIPGVGAGKYDGAYHGPPTGMWFAWTGMTTIKREEVVAGDILLWAGHMGIALGSTDMISALNPREGTKVTVIDKGVNRGPLVRCGRLI